MRSLFIWHIFLLAIMNELASQAMNRTEPNSLGVEAPLAVPACFQRPIKPRCFPKQRALRLIRFVLYKLRSLLHRIKQFKLLLSHWQLIHAKKPLTWRAVIIAGHNSAKQFKIYVFKLKMNLPSSISPHEK